MLPPSEFAMIDEIASPSSDVYDTPSSPPLADQGTRIPPFSVPWQPRSMILPPPPSAPVIIPTGYNELGNIEQQASTPLSFQLSTASKNAAPLQRRPVLAAASTARQSTADLLTELQVRLLA